MSTASYPCTGPAWARSSALPCGMPSITSTSTTSPSSRSTVYWATEAPTWPAPTTVIFGRAMIGILSLSERLHAFDDGRAELRALHFLRPFHEPGEVIGDDLLRERLLDARVDAIGRLRPPHVAQHHLAGEDDRAGVDLVLARVLGGGAVGRLEERVPGVVVDVGAGRDADASHLRGQSVGQEIAREVAARNHVELVGTSQDLLQEGVGDGVLDEDLPRGRLPATIVPGHELVGELALGQGIAPLHEHPFRVLLDIALVDEGHVPAPVLDGVTHGSADEPLRAFLGHGLDPDGRALREPDLVDLHLLLEEVDDFLRFGRALLPLDARVDVLGVLAEDDHVDLLGVLDGRGHALEVLDGAETHVEIEHLAQGDVQRAEALADGRGERALDGDQILADNVEGFIGEEIRRAVAAVHRLRLFARVHLGPRDLALAAVGLLDGRVEHAHGGGPDVGARPVALDEGDDGMIRHLELAVADGDLLAGRDLHA